MIYDAMLALQELAPYPHGLDHSYWSACHPVAFHRPPTIRAIFKPSYLFYC